MASNGKGFADQKAKCEVKNKREQMPMNLIMFCDNEKTTKLYGQRIRMRTCSYMCVGLRNHEFVVSKKSTFGLQKITIPCFAKKYKSRLGRDQKSTMLDETL